MSIMVCNLEVPVCWLEYGKASKSLREIIVFLRFPKYLNNHWDRELYLFMVLGGTLSGMVMKGVELLCYKPDPYSLGLSLQYLLNLSKRRKAIRGIRKQHLFKG